MKMLLNEKKKKLSLIMNMKYFAEARTYLERVRAKDPRRNRVDWVGPLYLDYSVLNDKIKAKGELEPFCNKL